LSTNFYSITCNFDIINTTTIHEVTLKDFQSGAKNISNDSPNHEKILKNSMTFKQFPVSAETLEGKTQLSFVSQINLTTGSSLANRANC